MLMRKFVFSVLVFHLVACPVLAQDEAPKGALKYIVSKKQLEEAGIGLDAKFPNKCFHRQDISLSQAFLARYEARGFTLPAICMAVTAGAWVRFDPETGRALRVLHLSRNGAGYLIDVPDCFKNGTPFLDCRISYSYEFGTKQSAKETDDYADSGREVDRTVRGLIAEGKFSRYCTCADLEVLKFDDETYLQIKGGSRSHGEQIAERYTCRLKDPPDCARRMIPGRDLKEWRLYEVDGSYDFVGTPFEGGTLYGPFEISPLLPRGYAYRIGSPEGDDESPFLELAPGEKLDVGD